MQGVDMNQKDVMKSPVLPKGPAVQLRLVVRRGSKSPRELDSACRNGRMPVDGNEVCELTANGKAIATGSIVERDGSYFFEGGKS